jgi:tetratricopeptide (TPR) repeat protein
MTSVRPGHTRQGRVLVGACAVLAALTTMAGCASRGSRAAVDPWPARLVAAGDQEAEGCYQCLSAALETYEALLAVRPDAAVAARAYRTAVHLAVRERLIGLYPGAYQAAPARLAAGAAPVDVDLASDALAAIPWRRGVLPLEHIRWPRDEELARLRRRRVALEAVADQDAWAATLLLALVAGNPIVGLDAGDRVPPGPPPGLDRETWRRRHPDDATLSFTRFTLLRSSLEDWAAFIAEHPRYLEAGAVTGEAEVGRGRLVTADEIFAAVLDEFPSLVPALAMRGDVRQRMEDFPLATTLYDTLLARVPDHREARLGRLKSLGFMGRHEDAIADADHMLLLGTWYIGEAHYWKAWNLFNLRRLDEARAEVDLARRLMVNADVDYLGGVIAFRQSRLDDAQRDFDSAVTLESRHCEAHFDRAALQLVQRAWDRASDGFDEAYTCHEARTPTFEQRIVDAREARMPDEAKAALVARREKALRDHRHQLGWARYNAAVAYANIGKPDVTRARVDEAIALGGPAVDAARDLIAQLRMK